jgi:hypothetical protein
MEYIIHPSQDHGPVQPMCPPIVHPGCPPWNCGCIMNVYSNG